MNYKTLTPEQRKAVLERLARAQSEAATRSYDLNVASNSLSKWHGISDSLRVDLSSRGAYKLGEFFVVHNLMTRLLDQALSALTEVDLEIDESIARLKELDQ
jgi:hypothetical protein